MHDPVGSSHHLGVAALATAPLRSGPYGPSVVARVFHSNARVRTRGVQLLGLWLAFLVAHEAHANLLPAPVRKAIAPASRTVRKATLLLAVKTSASLNKVDGALRPDHPGLADAMARTRGKMRPLSPVRLAGFAAKHVKDNPAIVPTYLALTLPIDAGRMYAAATLPPAVGGAVYALTSVPETLGALFAAEHAARFMKSDKGARPTMRDTLHGLVGEYREYNERQDRRLSRAMHALGE